MLQKCKLKIEHSRQRQVFTILFRLSGYAPKVRKLVKAKLLLTKGPQQISRWTLIFCIIKYNINVMFAKFVNLFTTSRLFPFIVNSIFNALRELLNGRFFFFFGFSFFFW